MIVDGKKLYKSISISRTVDVLVSICSPTCSACGSLSRSWVSEESRERLVTYNMTLSIFSMLLFPIHLHVPALGMRNNRFLFCFFFGLRSVETSSRAFVPVLNRLRKTNKKKMIKKGKRNERNWWLKFDFSLIKSKLFFFFIIFLFN